MKKTIYLLNVGDYAPEITKLTYPYIDQYAEKIGASVHVIKTRKFPDWDLDYEKLQIYELAKQRGDDWAIYIDSDALVHPETPDLTEMIPMNTVAHHGADFANLRFKYDDYFRRDGRNIGSANWFAIASKQCLDLWRPLDDIKPKEAVERISLINEEIRSGMKPDHLVSDFALSRNIARFGLKFTTLKKTFTDLGLPTDVFFHHIFCVTNEEKAESIQHIIDIWNNKTETIENKTG